MKQSFSPRTFTDNTGKSIMEGRQSLRNPCLRVSEVFLFQEYDSRQGCFIQAGIFMDVFET